MFFRGKKTADDDQRDWAVEATDLIERTVDRVRDTAVVPLTTIARGVVYGLLAAFVGGAAAVLFAVAFVRLLDVYLDNIPNTPENVWFAYLVSGAVFVVLGLFAWSKRSPKRAGHEG